ncbi:MULTISPECIES: hypothetical protein [unclassified Caballeronia]|nr:MULTISPECIES: hypothetical protein [unclassified Caballeronia]MDR5763120.1 hypothetical protein [Caballeronia sp. LZ035]MDR5884003.1 hypothetical protein [Caballeronia sp. LZ032]
MPDVDGGLSMQAIAGGRPEQIRLRCVAVAGDHRRHDDIRLAHFDGFL